MGNLTTNSLINDIKTILHNAKSRVYQTINSTMTKTYWEIGKRIVEEEQQGKSRATYGKEILENISNELTKEFSRGFSVANLKNMRQFYLTFSKRQTVSSEFELSYSHYIFLSRITNKDERNFYEIESIQNSWSLRELKRVFNSGLFERLALSRDKSKTKELEHFLLELGKGFTFVARQKKVTIDEKHFKIDLVFYNRLLKCFVAIDLKIEELKHQDIGQMMMYVNYFDRVEKTDDETPTIGIILCKDKSKALVEMALPKDNSQIYASKYLTILPNKEEFQRLLESEDE